MTIDNPVVLAVILLALLAGIGLCLYVIFRFVRNVGSSKQRTARKAGAERPVQSQAAGPDPAERLAEWAGDSTPPPEQTDADVGPSPLMTEPEGDAIEIFRVLRVGSLGELVVEVEGRRHRKITQIRDGTVGRRVLLAIQELDDFVGPHGQKPLPEMHRLSPTSVAPVEPTPRLDPDLAFLGALGESDPDEGSTEQRVDLVGYWRKGLGSALRRGSVEEPASPKSFIDEIEELLQLRLASRSDLLGRGIHFRSNVTGELRIEVDGRLYDRMDAIPEPAIVAFLKETIRAWEKS
jgi:hypothetical protein